MKYEFKKINELILPKWKVYLGFSRNFQLKVLENPVQKKEEWIYPVEIVSYTTKWLIFTIKITEL
jgi:hypothetical protein